MASNATYPGTYLTLPNWNTPFLTGSSTLGNGSTTFGSGDCAKCHGYPPMTSTHSAVVAATECKGCHPHVNPAGNGFDTPALHIDTIVQANGSCTSCHANIKGARVNVMQQFSTATNSHHYQGTTKINGTVCYACHWEADSLGAKTTYHGGTGTANVDLVIWNATTRPTTYTANVTGTTYLSGGATASLRT